jgi:uncharacterized membrane protein
MRLATRITVGILAAELLVMVVLLLLGDRWEDMGWPVFGTEHPLVGLGFLLPPLIALTVVVLVLLAATRILLATMDARRGRRAEAALSASPPSAARR